MKKKIPCPVSNGKGYVSWMNRTEDTCSTGTKTCPSCDGIGVREVALTNADHIRAMSVEELARLFVSAVSDGCPPEHDWDCKKDEEGWDACDCCWAMWLRQPVEEDTNGMQELS